MHTACAIHKKVKNAPVSLPFGLGMVVLLNSQNSDVNEKALFHLLKAFNESTPSYRARFDKPAITLSKDIVNKYIGNYEINPGLSIKTFTEGDGFYVQMTGQPKGIVDAVADNWFISKPYKVEFEFVNDKLGNCTKMVIHQNGQEIPAIKK
ncbi:MAG: DUF3471 domain-containing protein [Taibaiella sp.]|nr:DUF3471 domain-containing protein [Taibaiella sp.]